MIGIRCEDPDPPASCRSPQARDASLQNEDHVKVVLGPFGTGGRGTCSPSTPAARGTTRSSTRAARSENANWDGIWEAATSRDAGGWACRNLDSGPDARVQAGLSGGTSTSSDASSACSRPTAGPAEPRLPGHADEPCWRSDRPARIRPGSRPDRSAGRDRGRRHPGAGRGRRRRIAAEPRRDPAARLERARVADGEHRLRRDRGRHAPHEPHAVPAVLPREAHVLPARAPTSSPSASASASPPAVLQPARRPGLGQRSADSRRREGQRAASGSNIGAQIVRTRAVDGRRARGHAGRRPRQAERARRVVGRRRSRPPAIRADARGAGCWAPTPPTRRRA